MNLDLLRSFFQIADLGSLSKAADRLRVSQSTLTRQMHSLEQEVGGALLERSPSGVALTATGHLFLDGMRPLVTKFDAVLTDTRKLARGQSSTLRIGYLMSAAADYLNPALAALRKSQPQVKVKLLDLSPGEQIAALRKGEIDLALLGYAGNFLAKEFYVRRLASVPIYAAMAESEPLALEAGVRLRDLRELPFVGAPEADIPGYNRWVTQAARKAGFRVRLLDDAESLGHSFALIVTDGAVSLLPQYSTRNRVPGVVFCPLREPALTWDLLVAWQRGRVSAPVKAMLEILPTRR